LVLLCLVLLCLVLLCLVLLCCAWCYCVVLGVIVLCLVLMIGIVVVSGYFIDFLLFVQVGAETESILAQFKDFEKIVETLRIKMEV
jgi:hypothetical protein